MRQKRETFRQQCIRLNQTISDNDYTYGLKEYDRQAAIARICEPHVVHSKRRAYCSHCGSEVHVLTQQECPVCHRRWGKPELVERCSRHQSYGYLCVMTTMEGLQVMRFWQVGYWLCSGEQTSYWVKEVERQFIRDDGERKGFALSRPMMTGGRYDAWNFSSQITIRDTEPRYWGYYGDTTTPRFDLPCEMTVIKSVIPMLRRNGLRRSMHGAWYPVAVVRGLLTKPQVETLWKQKHWLLAEHAAEYGRLDDVVMAAVRICTRNHYRISDPKMWIDHIHTLYSLHLDTHNAHYVCPKDLNAAHTVMTERLNRHRAKMEAERREREQQERLKRLEKARQTYQQQWGSLLSLQLTGQDLDIQPLHTVDEFKQEGDAMHHCVFANAYYMSKTSLILSARDGEGRRLATIEYDIPHGTIEQCRAACNAVPERDAEIRTLITSHREDFERLMKAA